MDKVEYKNYIPVPYDLLSAKEFREISSDVDLLTVSKRMGHSKISTTLDIYTHRLKKDDHEAADAMENVMRRKKNK
ncbi:MAG: hypothetical protein IJM14_00920 [Lachnospiraceae bacterium]|nr:hypothetical protein [Lachnospiraceae bacterium]